MTKQNADARHCEKFLFNGRMFACPEGIYLPAEDSFLLAEIVEVPAGCSALDMGCGSGIQALNILYKGAGKVICADINEAALRATVSNCKAAGFGSRAKAIQSDLFSAFGPGRKFDTIVFNPPYVETTETKTKGMGNAGQKKFLDLDGGHKGREVLDRFLEEMPMHLAKGGACYFLQTDLNGRAKTEALLKKLGFGLEIAGRKKLFFEELLVFRAGKKPIIDSRRPQACRILY